MRLNQMPVVLRLPIALLTGVVTGGIAKIILDFIETLFGYA
jgi:hypothetical protein